MTSTTTRTNAKETARQEAITELRDMIKPGDTVYTILRHVSRSGMMRHIEPVIFSAEDSKKISPRYIGYLVARALDWKLAPGNYSHAIKVSGCGMDMGFHLVESLSQVLCGYQHGYECLGDHCPSSAHQGANYAVRTPGEVHHDGYAIAHRWL